MATKKFDRMTPAEADLALLDLGRAQMAVEALNAEIERQTMEVQGRYARQVSEVTEREAEVRGRLVGFAEENREALRVVPLRGNYGEVRVDPTPAAVHCADGIEEAEVIAKLEKMGRKELLKIEPKLDKAAIKKAWRTEEKTLRKLGITVEGSTKIVIAPDLGKIKSLPAQLAAAG